MYFLALKYITLIFENCTNFYTVYHHLKTKKPNTSYLTDKKRDLNYSSNGSFAT